MLKISSFLPTLRGQRGSSLVLAVGMLLVLSIGSTAVIQYTSASARSSNLSRAGQTAAAVAEAGLNQAASVLAQQAEDDTLVLSGFSGSQSFAGGSVSWTATANNLYHWTLSATSTVPNPTGGSDVHRTVTRDYEITYEPGLGGGNEAWNYLFAASDDTCAGHFQNSFSTSSPVFITGGLCMENLAAIVGGSGSVVKVGGRATLQNSARIGSAATLVENVHVGGGCSTSSGGPWDTPCTSSHRVWATNFSDLVTTPTKPPVDLDGWFANAKPGPLTGCTSSTGSPPPFDDDATLNRSLGNVYLFNATYTCEVWSGGTLLGRLNYDDTTKVMTIMGVIFFDGNLKLDTNDDVVYGGNGVMYASGQITLEGDTTLCGIANCDTDGWDPNTNMLTLVAGSSTDSDSFVIKNSAKFQGAVYAVNGFSQRNSSRIEGPIIAERLSFENNGYADKWVQLTGLSNGMPAVGSQPIVSPVPGTFGG